MKALVISGGGSKGAFAGGVAQYLIEEAEREYDIFLGTSTGSLLVPHLSIGEIQKIYESFTSVGMDDIYNIIPFKVKQQKNGSIKTSINHFNILCMFLNGKKTFGDHKNLRNTIEKIMSKDDFDKMQHTQKRTIITVSNFTTKRVEYKYLDECNYNDFCDWMWASCSFVPFMGLVNKNGYEYADGGFGNYTPIEEAINQGATEIDVIVLNPRHRAMENVKTSNAFDLLLQSMLFMQNQIAYNDVLIGHLESIYNRDVRVKFFFTPKVLTEYSFYFNPDQMKKWWHEGFRYADKRMNNT